MHEYTFFFAATRIQINKKSKDESFIAHNWWEHYLWRIYFLIRKLWCSTAIIWNMRLNRRILEMYSRAKEIKSIARYRFERFLPSHTYRVYWTYFISWILEREIYGTPWLATYFIYYGRAKYEENGKERQRAKRRKAEKEKGGQGKREKWEHCEAFAKLAFDKSSFWRGGGPTTTEPFESRILVDKPPYGHPTAHQVCAKSIVTIDDHLVRRTRACASIYPFLRWRLWRFQNKPI